METSPEIKRRRRGPSKREAIRMKRKRKERKMFRKRRRNLRK